MTYIFEEEGWKEYYRNNPDSRKNVWIYVKFSNNSVVFLKDIKEWLTIPSYCKQKSLDVHVIGLQYKSHRETIDCSQSDGAYVVTSLRGQLGADAKQCFTLGKIQGDKVLKELWSTPELTREDHFEDSVETCFREALVYNEKTKSKII